MNEAKYRTKKNWLGLIIFLTMLFILTVPALAIQQTWGLLAAGLWLATGAIALIVFAVAFALDIALSEILNG